MTGCRVGAKNTLVKNYLHLAERAGARGPPADDGDATYGPRSGGGYEVRTGPHRRDARQAEAYDQPPTRSVLAAGTYGTARLLHAMRDTGALPRLSPRLGT